jgi:hypothetical protein
MKGIKVKRKNEKEKRSERRKKECCLSSRPVLPFSYELKTTIIHLKQIV